MAIPPAPISDCTGVLLAGGRAKRLGGITKGHMLHEGEPIVERSLRLFGQLFAETLLVANQLEPYAGLGVRIASDQITGRGVPGGLHAALSAARTEWIFLAGCDMPFLSPEGIQLLAGLRSGQSAVVAVWQGRLEPLHAFWSRRALPQIERCLHQGEPSMWELAHAIGARLVEETAWRSVDPEGRAFANANTPEDVARLGLAFPE